jgi:FlaA1/EpsC-like NDP-sugar epimerase
MKMEWLYTRLGKVLVDTVGLCVALAAGYLIRFDGHVPREYFTQAVSVGPYAILLTLASLGAQGAYSRVWRYTNLRDIGVLLAGLTIPVAVFAVLRFTVPDPWMTLRVPLSVIATYFTIGFLVTAGARASRRLVYEQRRGARNPVSPVVRRLLIIGAGDTGIRLARDLAHRGDVRVVAFLDDDIRKSRTTIMGVRVRGTVEDLGRVVVAHRIDEVIVACRMPDRKFRELVQACEEIPVRIRVLTVVDDAISERVSGRLRELRIEDLLPRQITSFQTAATPLLDTYRGRRVLVTGAGGSIGSELCRKLTTLQPEVLLLLDHDENNLFEIYSDLIHLGWRADRIVQLIADIRRPPDMWRVFNVHRPDVILHAAAFKHVPFLEAHPIEAVENNVIATASLVDLAIEFDSEALVLVSTDKAVHPTSIMGATKRAAELVVEQAANRGLRASCVRFGNVLDSRGSVVPIFRRQIARGGPVTVTDPDATRYFMTIAEASQLVLQAASLEGDGRVFVLDMGAAVRIIDLARDMIHLSGLREPEDIEIKFVGLRPGERLHEQLSDRGTDLAPTPFDGILVAPASGQSPQSVSRMLHELEEAVSRRDEAMVIQILSSEPIQMESRITDGAPVSVSVAGR